MLINTLKSTNSVILSSIQAVNNKNVVENYLSQLTKLNSLTSQLDHLLRLTSSITSKGIAGNIITKETISSLASAVDNCGQKTYDHSLDASTVASLKNAVTLFRNELDTSWKNIAKSECTPIIEAILSLRGLLDDKKEANDLLGYYEKVIQNTPVSVTALDTYIKNVERGRQIIENLHFASDKEVRVFIKKVSSQHATVNDLTPHIMDWLKENNLISKIHLRF